MLVACESTTDQQDASRRRSNTSLMLRRTWELVHAARCSGCDYLTVYRNGHIGLLPKFFRERYCNRWCWKYDG